MIKTEKNDGTAGKALHKGDSQTFVETGWWGEPEASPNLRGRYRRPEGGVDGHGMTVQRRAPLNLSDSDSHAASLA